MGASVRDFVGVGSKDSPHGSDGAGAGAISSPLSRPLSSPYSAPIQTLSRPYPAHIQPIYSLSEVIALVLAQVQSCGLPLVLM